ncbi:MAG TPA: sulfotransferase [Nocardioidaceae bacterium]|nr:sulfotransferase [Nocardioidaceae bacterium]
MDTTLYIGGSGRSGSTLLECLLAELPQVTVLGEVAHLWERGVVLNELCACGQPFHDCEFWSAVGTDAFNGWASVDIERIRALKDAVDRQRRMPATTRRRPSRRIKEQSHEYADYFRRIYDSARRVTGASVVVDSSKVAPTALALSHHEGIDLRILHIVRDSRGVAYSWSKHVPRPETGGEEAMPRLGARASTQLWLSHNLSMGALSYRGVPVHRVRYEDLLDDVAGTVRDSWSALELPGTAELPLVDERTVVLNTTHSVAGNPMRFRTGSTTLRPDTAWKDEMEPRQRRLVTALSYPALKAYRYL